MNITNEFKEGSKRFPVAQSNNKEIRASFGSLKDLHTTSHALSTYVEHGFIYIGDGYPGFFKANWKSLVLAAVVAVLVLFVVYNITGCIPADLQDPHDTIAHYLNSSSIKKLSALNIIALMIFFIVYLPFLLETTVLTLALATLIPCGFVFGLIEHRFVFLWAVVVLFIQVGGLLDLFADVALLSKFVIAYFVGDNSQDDSEFMDGEDKTFFWIRVLLTLGGSLMAVFFLIYFMTCFREILAKMTGARVPKDKSKTPTNTCRGSPQGIMFALAITAILWKLVMMALRVHLIYAVARSLIKIGGLDEKIQRRVQWLEMILYIDLMWSGLPLGVLTALELTVYNDDLVFDQETTYEMLKLAALAVDLVGASFLFYFIIVGLIKKVPILHHHRHHKHHSELPHESQHGEPPTASQSINRSGETDPLLIQRA